MDNQEWSIKDIDPNNEILLHGGKWSEEAKRRVSEARRAGRSVADMFGDLYKKIEKTVSSAAKSVSNAVKPTAKVVSKTASNLIRVAKKTAFPTTSKTTTGTLGKKSGDKAMKAAGYKKRKVDWKVVKKVQDKLDKKYGQGKYKKSESQKLDQARGKAMDKRENREKIRKQAEKSAATVQRNKTRNAIKNKQKAEKNRSKDAIGENTRKQFRNGDVKSGNDALIRKYKGKMKDHMSKSPEERRKNYKQYNEWNNRVKDLEDQNKRIAKRNKGSNLEENNTRSMENMYESSKNASESVRRRNASRTKDLEAQNESYYKSKKRKNNIQQSATFDYQAALVSVQGNQNELKHYGVAGMKWGTRRAYGKSKAYIKAYGKNMYNTVRHPIYHNKAFFARSAHSGLGGYALAGAPTHTALEYSNSLVGKLVDSKRKMPKEQRYSLKNRLSKRYRLGESKRVEAALRSTPYRVQGISYTGE